MPASVTCVSDSTDGVTWCGPPHSPPSSAACSVAGAIIAPSPGKFDQLQAAAEKLRRAGLAGHDMRLAVAHHRAPWRRQVRQRQRIGRGPGRHQINRDLALEQTAKAALRRAGSPRRCRSRADGPTWPAPAHPGFPARPRPRCRLRNSSSVFARSSRRRRATPLLQSGQPRHCGTRRAMPTAGNENDRSSSK